MKLSTYLFAGLLALVFIGFITVMTLAMEPAPASYIEEPERQATEEVPDSVRPVVQADTLVSSFSR